MPISNPRPNRKSPPVKENMAGEVVTPDMVMKKWGKVVTKPSKGVKK